MDAKYFEEIKEREQAATSGPWFHDNSILHCGAGFEIAKISGRSFHDIFQRDKNADFIAHARTDIPSLVAEVEQLQAEIRLGQHMCAPVEVDEQAFVNAVELSKARQEIAANDQRIAILQRALELMHTDMEESTDLPIPNVDDYIQQAADPSIHIIIQELVEKMEDK